jgi:hypothetical protein
VSVKVVVLMVEGFMVSLKVAVTTVLGQRPVAPAGGVTEITVGTRKPPPPVHGPLAVLKVHIKLLASAMPCASRAPVVIVAV